MRVANENEPPAMFGHVAVRFKNYIFVFGGMDTRERPLSLHEICMYNFYTEYWRKHVIPDQNLAPPLMSSSCAVAIGANIYLFSGYEHDSNSCATNALWKLTITSTGLFNWSKIKFDDQVKTPSPRQLHSGWEHLGKLWTFGGTGKNNRGYLAKHGEFNTGYNNQLLCFDPSRQGWTNVTSYGTIPDPRAGHSTTITGEKVWLYGGYGAYGASDDLYQLTLSSLVWTQITTCGELKPLGICHCSLAVGTDMQLVLNASPVGAELVCGTWVLDIPSLTWRKHAIQQNTNRYSHTSTQGVNSTVVIIGGGDRHLGGQYPKYQIIHLKREPKSLLQLTMKTLYYYKDVMPWNSLPKRLPAQIMFPGIDG